MSILRSRLWKWMYIRQPQWLESSYQFKLYKHQNSPYPRRNEAMLFRKSSKARTPLCRVLPILFNVQGVYW